MTMGLQTMSSNVPEVVRVSRGDPIYMAHAYLTKIPVSAITPFLRLFTEPGDLVLDPFAGSGMTGLAAAMMGRSAVVQDISALGQHVGANLLNFPPVKAVRAAAENVHAHARRRLGGDPYLVPCSKCGADAQLSRAIWSRVFECRKCSSAINYYHVLEAANWKKSEMECPECSTPFKTRGSRVLREDHVRDVISCSCTSSLFEQKPTPHVSTLPAGLPVPDLPIEPWRQMYNVSALGRHELTSTASFYSERNLGVLASIYEGIRAITDKAVRSKVLFAFTAVLTRASKRYQWSRKRPLNAANHNYYIAPVFYEWNVFDLHTRKVEAVLRSDSYIRNESIPKLDDVAQLSEYRLASSTEIDLPDDSVDYIFTDPPFGSNLFYSDMNLFYEAWLDEVTDPSEEAVVDRTETDGDLPTRTEDWYEKMLKRVLIECQRVLKPEGRLSLVFSNAKGSVWGLLQRAIKQAGFDIDASSLTCLDKGQRSVKGLASGFERIVTMDLILTLVPVKGEGPQPVRHHPSDKEINAAVSAVASSASDSSPSEVYIRLLRRALENRWDLSTLDYSVVAGCLEAQGLVPDPRTGRFRSTDAIQQPLRFEQAGA